jgi:hypothetical protein
MGAVGRKQQRAIKTWSEQDLYTSWRHLLLWQPGMRRWIKRQTHKRERRQGKRDVAEDRNQ